jgi:hypothetical protein
MHDNQIEIIFLFPQKSLESLENVYDSSVTDNHKLISDAEIFCKITNYEFMCEVRNSLCKYEDKLPLFTMTVTIGHLRNVPINLPNPLTFDVNLENQILSLALVI